VGVPIIADADTGYGNALSAQRARAFERRRRGVHLEDQTFPKKCGHYDDKGLVPAAEMVQKLHAVRGALHIDFIVIARTDAIAVEATSSSRAHRRLSRSRRRHGVRGSADHGTEIADIAGARLQLINMFQRQDTAAAGVAPAGIRLPRRHHSERRSAPPSRRCGC
jgi:hypothetical protein